MPDATAASLQDAPTSATAPERRAAPARGLWSPADWTTRERDACGIGFVADIAGRPSHRVVEKALEALGNLAHRGAVAADGQTSDGVGVLIQIPRRLLARELSWLGGGAVDESLAVGAFFLPRRGSGQSSASRRLIERAIADSGLEFLAWRPVPVDPKVLGEEAAASRPAVAQALLRPTVDEPGAATDRRLFQARRRIERRAAAADLAIYPLSLSRRVLVYKGMAPATALGDFYPDLHDPDVETAVALFHQRFSTNTRSSWRLAQPFRGLAHNGEINTIQGNLNWMRARESQLACEALEPLDQVMPVLDATASDSAMLDQMLELLVLAGRDPLHALAILMPEASRDRSEKDPELRAFYDYHATLLEPWDGPAAVVYTDGRLVAAGLDRNGLRPQRWWRTRDGLLIAGSEAGMVHVPDDDVVEKGRLGPGEMLAVDLGEGRLLRDAEIKHRLATARPWREWLDAHLIRPPEQSAALGATDENDPSGSGRRSDRRRLQKIFGYSKELLDRILDPMVSTGKPPVGSMGNDAPLAVLSTHPQLLSSYFKQRFAQVTNPPIDPLRERLVFSLDTFVGGWANLLEERPEAAHLVRLDRPVVSAATLDWLLALDEPAFRSARLDATFAVAEGEPELRRAVEALCLEAERALDDGASLLVLSDRGVDAERAPIPMLLATSAVHQHLVRVGKRMRCSLICHSGEPREDHHVACLLAFGATVVCPYLALETVTRRAEVLELSAEDAVANYLQALEAGLLKILSRLGVGPMASYHGAQLFEALGLDADVVDRYFTGTPSRVGGVGLKTLAGDVLTMHREAFGDAAAGGAVSEKLIDRGFFRFRKGGEHHGFRPEVFKALHKAVRTGDAEAYRRYADSVDDGRPTRLRDLLSLRRGPEALPLDQIEPAHRIVRRFATAAMSLGALSREAHEVLAVGMNRLGARSNSGEGGEHLDRFRPYARGAVPQFLGRWQPRAGDWAGSAIKQVASGRFGVTPAYLASARELEIKMAQGSKPGEGGQIPGHKVTLEIAEQRGAVAGVPLVSPPPHHDIYSIEDLAQLIADLRQVNPEARVGVKLVSLAGVGTIACGVVKAGADYVLISGDDGGTGASPLSSIKHAGMPWELGLAETHEALVASDLRGRVALRVDGGLKTGRDLVVAALLGAEEFGFGTVPLIAIGCVMARQCHLDTCPVGIATQREDLRRRFPGAPEQVVSFMLFVAEEVRHHLAALGLRSLDEAVGRRDLLDPQPERAPVDGLQLDALLVDPDPAGTRPRRQVETARLDRPTTLDDLLWQEVRPAVALRRPVRLRRQVGVGDRSLGGRLAGQIALDTEGEGLDDGLVRIDCEGAAGQSFGLFLPAGVEMHLAGEAQDYVGKGLAGGRVVLRPPELAALEAGEQVIAGNTILYGATAGELFAAGRVGERFCVRNSGATAVVEGCGDHGCEYMTRGLAVVLGEIGRNFGAGMSGGRAYVWDAPGLARRRIDPRAVRDEPLDADDRKTLRGLLERHRDLTGSARAAEILDAWDTAAGLFRRIVPNVGTAIAVEPPTKAAAADDLAAAEALDG
ncbi:MAG: glutamate synthase large subunit [Acidobacteriota bacterium]